MKKLWILLLCLPFMVNAQEEMEAPDLIFEIVKLTPKPEMMDALETAMAAHNEQFHGEGTYGARVYTIESGPDVGKWLWVMGPTTWDALDNRPGEGAHNDDWANVMKNMKPYAHASYWSFDRKNSHFPADFTIKNLYVMHVDVARGKWKDVTYLLEKVKTVSREKMEDETYGIYWNQTGSTKEGRDLSVIWFFDSWSWMGEEGGFNEKFNEMYGEGSWDRWMDDWIEATNGTEIELWSLRDDLSGASSKIMAAERQ